MISSLIVPWCDVGSSDVWDWLTDCGEILILLPLRSSSTTDFHISRFHNTNNSLEWKNYSWNINIFNVKKKKNFLNSWIFIHFSKRAFRQVSWNKKSTVLNALLSTFLLIGFDVNCTFAIIEYSELISAISMISFYATFCISKKMIRFSDFQEFLLELTNDERSCQIKALSMVTSRIIYIGW